MTSAIPLTAFGAIVGYLGAEVAQDSTFDRLLWPSRFHNYLDAGSFTKLALLMPMSGPLHRAALSTLDGFRDQGLYKGFLRGDMLGTAFYQRTAPTGDGKYVVHSAARTGSSKKMAGENDGEEIRNCFWLEVIRQVEERRKRPPEARKSLCAGGEEETAAPLQKRRAARPVYFLSLKVVSRRTGTTTAGGKEKVAIEVSESRVTAWTILGILASELSTVLVAIATGLWCRFGDKTGESSLPDVWLVGFFCIPLVLKLVAALFTVRREDLLLAKPDMSSSIKNSNDETPIKQQTSTGEENKPGEGGKESRDDKSSHIATTTANSPQHPFSTTTQQVDNNNKPEKRKDIIEIRYPSLGFILIGTTPPITSRILQFFHHYGHPVRSSYMDRIREAVSIMIVYAFVFYFPVGLFLLSWGNEPSQYLWLGQQLYCIFAMHIVRLAGWQGAGRTEELVAKHLLAGRAVYLIGDKRGEIDGCCIEAKLDVKEVPSVGEGRAMVARIVKGNNDSQQREPWWGHWDD